MRMFKPVVGITFVAIVSVCLIGCASKTRTVGVDSLSFQVNNDWHQENPNHPTRRLQFRVPSHTEGVEDGRIVVWNFSRMRDTGDGRIIGLNMERWGDQFRQDDGTPVQNMGRKAEYLINNIPVYTYDVSGLYVHETSPGSGIRVNKPAHRLIGAYVVAPQGDYIVKFIGPKSLVSDQRPAFDAFLRSMRYDQWEPAPQPSLNDPSRPRTVLTATRN
jgi:hypothetical protein